MIIDFSKVRIFVRPGKTDMRKAINGLSILAESSMGQNPLTGSLFVFCSENRTRLKIVYWDKNGFCLWHKRLERDKFPWPATTEAAREINREELLMLLSGIDFWKAHQSLHFDGLQ